MLHYETVTPYLRNILVRLMSDEMFNSFRLVGGTSLSLCLGHRVSIDIDLFTDDEYGSVDFASIQTHLRQMFPYCVGDCGNPVGMGATYIIGTTRDDAVKLDLFYTDKFIAPMTTEDGIRMASTDDIIAMKLDVVARGGRKKDFWDIYALAEQYSATAMLKFHEKRYPYGYSRGDVMAGFTRFEKADNEPDPHCLRNESWEAIKIKLAQLFSEV